MQIQICSWFRYSQDLGSFYSLFIFSQMSEFVNIFWSIKTNFSLFSLFHLQFSGFCALLCITYLIFLVIVTEMSEFFCLLTKNLGQWLLHGRKKDQKKQQDMEQKKMQQSANNLKQQWFPATRWNCYLRQMAVFIHNFLRHTKVIDVNKCVAFLIDQFIK